MWNSKWTVKLEENKKSKKQQNLGVHSWQVYKVEWLSTNDTPWNIKLVSLGGMHNKNSLALARRFGNTYYVVAGNYLVEFEVLNN